MRMEVVTPAYRLLETRGPSNVPIVSAFDHTVTGNLISTKEIILRDGEVCGAR
jgi:hypothetical protein